MRILIAEKRFSFDEGDAALRPHKRIAGIEAQAQSGAGIAAQNGGTSLPRCSVDGDAIVHNKAFIEEVKSYDDSVPEVPEMEQIELRAERKIRQWMRVKEKTCEFLLLECGIVPNNHMHKAGLDFFDSVGGLGTIISVFCTPRMNFSADYFKAQMKEMGMNPAIYHRLYNILFSWKDKAEALAMPMSCITPSMTP